MGMLTQNDKEICFPINKNNEVMDEDALRINGDDFTKKAISYFKLNGEKVPNWINRLIEDGLIEDLIYPFGKSKQHFCISHTNS